MGLAKRVIELDRDILTFDQRYGFVEGATSIEEKQKKRVRMLVERRNLINFFKKCLDNKGILT